MKYYDYRKATKTFICPRQYFHIANFNLTINICLKKHFLIYEPIGSTIQIVRSFAKPHWSTLNGKYSQISYLLLLESNFVIEPEAERPGSGYILIK